MKNNYLEAGKIVSTHGVRGEVKVLPWADSPEFLTRFKKFYLVKPSPSGEGVTAVQAVTDEGRPGLQSLPLGGSASASGGRPMAAPTALTVESSRVQKTVVLMKFKGVDTVEAAQALRDRVISIARNDPHIPTGTVFQADLIGLPVRAAGEEIGRIAEILSMPASEVWVVKGAHEYMIPNVRAFVPHVDPALGYVEVNLIEGMRTDAE